MQDFKILNILDRFRRILEKAGVNYEALRLILQLKLIMDSRRVPLAINDYRKKEEENTNKNYFIRSLWIYILYGLFLMIFVIINENLFFQMTLFFSIVLFLVMTSLTSDFSSVLLDTKDKNIILTKPIDGRTLGFAKVIHIFIYMLYLTISLGGPSLIAALIKKGILFSLLLLVEYVLVDLLVIVITALVYLFILRFFDGEKLKNIINYTQIILTMALAIGYQLALRVFDFVNFEWVIQPAWWHYFMIPIWFAAPFEWFINGTFNPHLLAFSLLALFVPLVAMAIYIRLMPVFENQLMKLTQVNNSSKISKNRLEALFAKWFCRQGEERVFFQFANQLMKNEREFKLKIYPSLGLSLVLPFIFLFTTMSTDGIGSLSFLSFLSIYFCALMIPNVVYTFQFSEKFKAAWIFRSAPVEADSSIKKGVLKASFYRYILSFYALQSILFIAIFGLEIVPDLIIVIGQIGLFTLISAKLLLTSLPFSISYNDIKPNSVKLFGAMFIVALMTIIHYVVHLMGGYALIGYILILVIVNYKMWK